MMSFLNSYYKLIYCDDSEYELLVIEYIVVVLGTWLRIVVTG